MHKLLLAATTALALTSIAAAQDSEDRSLVVHNEGSLWLCEVYISHINSDHWGRDLYGDTCQRPGRYRTVDPGWQLGYCMMNMKFVYEDGKVLYEENFNICEESDYYVYHPDDGD